MNYRILLLMLYSVFFISWCGAVNAAEFSRYLNNYSVEEGLSQSSANQIIQDKFGYIWVATAYGLNRFDGYKFEQIPGPSNSFSSDGIVHLSELNDGRLLISTFYNGAYLLNPKTLESQEIFSGKLLEVSDEVMSVDFSLQAEDTLWLAIGQRLIEYDLHTQQIHIRYEMGNDEDGIRSLANQGSNLYLGTTQGLKLFDLETKKLSDIDHLPKGTKKNFKNNNVKSFYWNKDLGLFVGTVQGLYLLNTKTKQVIEALTPELNVWGMVNLGQELFISTQRGLYSLDLHSKKYSVIAELSDVNPLITNNTIRNIYIDNGGLIWLTSDIQGVFTFNPSVRNFSSYSRLSTQKLSNSVVNDYIEEPSGVLWVATENGLNRVDQGSKSSEIFFLNESDDPFPGRQSVYRIFPQPDGKMWLWHGDGLSLFNPRAGKTATSTLTKSTNSDFQKMHPYGLEQIEDDTFFFISAKGHFSLDIKNNKIEELTPLNKDLKPEGSEKFLKNFISNGSILLATIGGLIEYNHVKKTYKNIYQLKDFHIHDYKYVSAWAQAKNGHVWLAVNSYGIVELDREYKVIREIKKEQGLTDLRVHGVIQSQSGDIWISSQSGLFKYDKSQEEITQYTAKQGLVSNEIYNTSKILSNGDIAFNSAGGLIFFDPQVIERESSSEMPVKIISVKVASREASYPFYQLMEEPFALDYDDYGITFTFSNFNFLKQGSVKYQLELKGDNKVFYESYEKNTVEFTRLVPGDYEFRVRVKSTSSSKPEQWASLKFKVNYNPFYSPIAYVLYAIIITLGLVGAYIRRYRQQSTLIKAHEQVLHAKERADLALEATDSGIWSFNKETGYVNQPRLNELGYHVPDNMLIDEYASYIHPDDLAAIKIQLLRFVNNEAERWDVCYRVKNIQGKWLWYRDMGKSSKIKGEIKQIFTGTYTNVTSTKANEIQAQLYGQVLRKMNEWLLILDKNLTPVTSNPAFKRRFLRPKEKLNRRNTMKVIGRRKLEQYISKIRLLQVDQKSISEEVVHVPAGFDIPILVSISAIGDSSVDYYAVVISDLSEQKKVENELKYLANYDPLTRLANRTLIRDRIEQAILYRKDNAIALLFIDLDRFKQVNDIHGHAIGDQLLIEVASRMNKVIGGQHSVGRQSGDEFVVLLEDISSPEDVSRYADMLITQLAEPYLLDSQTIYISSSIGIAFYPYDSVSCEELMQNADIAMLHAKDRGRNCYRFFTEEMNTKIRNRVLLENKFIQAVQRNSLTNFYQPIVNISNNEVVGAELLLSWFNEDEIISPNVFIPLAESMGQIVKVTEMALERSLKELQHWLTGERYLSINLSALHISQPQIIGSFLSILSEAKVSPKNIKLEITEGVLIDDTENSKRQLKQLKDVGFGIFLDDFGTGYSSLTYINQFPIDVIKIDQCFVKDIGNDKTSRSIVQTISNLAENIGSYCVVEGVEEINQVEILAELGCQHMQGFYFARPMPATEFLSRKSMQRIGSQLNSINQDKINT